MTLKSIIIKVATVLLAVLLPIIILPTILIFICYRQLVYIILKISYRRQFVGLMEGPDVLWSLTDVSKSIINAILIINSSTDTDTFINKTKAVICEKCFHKSSKLTYLKRKMFGYSFLLNHDFSIDDYIKRVKVYGNMNREYLENFISHSCSSGMPVNDSALCEILIFDKPEELSNGQNRFFVLLRIDHSIGDGFSLLDFLLRVFSDKTYIQHTDLWTNVGTSTYNWLSYLSIVLYGCASVIIQTLLRPIDRNVLHSQKKLCGEKIVAWVAEEEEVLVPVVKMIKNKNLGTHFSDVVLTAISASLSEFYLKKCGSVPDHLTCVIPKPITKTINSLHDFKNTFSVAQLRLPLSVGDVTAILEAVKTQTFHLRSSPDFVVNYWLLKLMCSIIPQPLLKFFIYSAHNTMIISILPGPQALSVFGELLEDLIFWIPHRGNTGVGLSVLTYDNRLQIGITMDKALLSNQEDLQSIVDNVFKYILKLYEQ